MSVDSTANQAKAQEKSKYSDATKIATPSLIALTNPALDIDIMTDLIFEDIGGQELINMSRNDTIGNEDLIYNPIKNTKDLSIQYNSNNIIKLDNTMDTYFKNFTIKLENRLPTRGTGPNKETVYLDPVTGDLVINVSFIEKDEQVEVQIINSGDIFNDTIY
jgi:hypothetical protein